jgi:hypothetical protein
MKKEHYVLLLGVFGLLFAGYLSGIKFFTDTCAFGESCPIFLGLPACYYGFFMYLGITAYALFRKFGIVASQICNEIIVTISGVGILFSGYFTLTELPILFRDGLTAYMLGLPSCALGLICYAAIFYIALRIKKESI